MRSRALPRFGPDGEVLRWYGATEDIDDLKQAEERLRRRWRNLQLVYDSAPIGLCVLDRDMRWTRINARLAEINGLPPEAHLGRTVQELLPGVAEAATALHRQVMDFGDAALGVEITGETPALPGVRRVWGGKVGCRSATGPARSLP